MKKRLVATLCSAVFALSSLTNITAQAAQSGGGFIITQDELDAYNASEDTTSTDTSSATNMSADVPTVTWSGYTDVRIYDKTFSGTLLGHTLYGAFGHYNDSYNFTVTQAELPVVSDGYKAIKVTSKRVATKDVYARNNAGQVNLHLAAGKTYSTSSSLYDSFGYSIDSYSTNDLCNWAINWDNDTAYLYWNITKCLLEPYGYTYEYIYALASQTYTELNDYTSKDWLGVDRIIPLRAKEIIDSAISTIYNNGVYDSVHVYLTTSGNYVYEMALDYYNYIYIIPNSEKIYFRFNDTLSGGNYNPSTKTIYCVALN
jgi:hypothetical protein